MGSEPQVVVHFSSGFGCLRRKQPAFFLAPAFTLLEAPTSFLNDHYCSSGKRLSPATWKNVAHALSWWLNWCLAIGLDWRIASRDDLIHYRDTMLTTISPATGRQYATGTVAARIETAVEFYSYCCRNEIYHGDIGQEARRDQHHKLSTKQDSMTRLRRGVHRRNAGSEISPKRRSSRGQPHPFLESELLALLLDLGPLPTQRAKDSARTTRNRLIVDWLYVTGLRLSELIGLRVSQILEVAQESDQLLRSFPLEIIGKYGKKRIIAVPTWLIEETRYYIQTERMLSIRRGRKNDCAQLFVSEPHHKSPGTPIKQRQVQLIISKACIRSGIVSNTTITDPISGRHFQTVRPRHSVHDLRHTYAAITYFAEKHSGNPEPWKLIQAQLGHSQLTTTEPASFS